MYSMVEDMRSFAAFDVDWTFPASWAYGDSLDDLPMLELVGSPPAVSPSKDS